MVPALWILGICWIVGMLTRCCLLSLLVMCVIYVAVSFEVDVGDVSLLWYVFLWRNVFKYLDAVGCVVVLQVTCGLLRLLPDLWC